MKQMKLGAALLAGLACFTFASCLNSDNESSEDGYVYATVQESMLGITLLGDDGITYIPSNYTAIQTTSGGYPERIWCTYKLPTGEIMTSEKKQYNITLVRANAIYTKAFNTRPDTLQTGYALNDLMLAWGVNGYLTVDFKFAYKSGETVDFEMYPTKAGHDTLYVKLHQSYGSNDGYNIEEALMSFRVPGLSNLEYQYPDLQPGTNDSIYIHISAAGSNETLSLKAFKVKLDY